MKIKTASPLTVAAALVKDQGLPEYEAIQAVILFAPLVAQGEQLGSRADYVATEIARARVGDKAAALAFRPAEPRALTYDEADLIVNGLNGPSREQLARLIVRELPTGQLDDIADDMKRRAYFSEIRSLAEAARGEIKSGDITDRDGLLEWITQTIDGHHDVIYTHAAQDVARYSDNDGAYVDNFGADGLVKDGAINWSAIAFAAMEADLIEQLRSEGVDVNDEADEWETDQPCDECKGTHKPDECPKADDADETDGAPEEVEP